MRIFWVYGDFSANLYKYKRTANSIRTDLHCPFTNPEKINLKCNSTWNVIPPNSDTLQLQMNCPIYHNKSAGYTHSPRWRTPLSVPVPEHWSSPFPLFTTTNLLQVYPNRTALSAHSPSGWTPLSAAVFELSSRQLQLLYNYQRPAALSQKKFTASNSEQKWTPLNHPLPELWSTPLPIYYK